MSEKPIKPKRDTRSHREKRDGMDAPRPKRPRYRNLPTVAIVGRPNVGKSAIFNRLAGRKIAIVHDMPGVTRDRISADCTRGSRPFSVIDTGGIGASLDDGFAAAVTLEADIAIEAADVIVFAVDAKDGITSIDEALSSKLRKSRQPLILLVNKVDEAKHESRIAEFTKFGIKNVLGVSAEHGRGFDELVEMIIQHLPSGPESIAVGEDGDDEKTTNLPPIKIALIGRPNVGKSSMINALLEDQRTIVSAVSGTTRDAIDVPFSHGGLDYIFIDTAGIRPRNKRESSVEIFSVMRAERSIRRADLCCLIIDASTGVLAQDRKIARQILDAGKPCLIILNKFDLYQPEGGRGDRLEKLKEHVEKELYFLHYAPMHAASALKGQHVRRIFKSVEDIRKAARDGVNTGTLNRLMHDAMSVKPPPTIKAKHNRRLKLLYATLKRNLDEERPIPTPDFILFVNQADLLQDNYARYLEFQIRKVSSYTGIPISFQVRERSKKKE